MYTFQGEFEYGRVLADMFRSSNAMPKEVRAAIAWCLTVEGAGTMDKDQAEAFVEEMFEDGRGGEESW